MNRKILILGFVGLFVCFSCNSKKEEPQTEDEKVYDGSISYISASVYDNPEDTTGNTPPAEPAVIPVCNLNILADNVTEIEGRTPDCYQLFYAMDAHISAGNKLKVVLSSEHSLWFCYIYPAENWKVITSTSNNVAFEVIQSGILSHLWIGFFPYNDINDEIRIDFYTNGATQPSKTKTLKIHYPCYTPYTDPTDSIDTTPIDSTLFYQQW
ncbi:MAG: hypothetical protein FWF72_01635 [Paludibacter sp.]|nr:hypothetical protein [Paludibacter sp.]